MAKISIEEIGIDDQQRLYIKVSRKSYEYVYRAATGVHWDKDKAFLHSPVPTEMTYLQWFSRIISTIIQEYDDHLEVTINTRWINTPEDLRSEIQSLKS
ncbi:MAG: hypothetical protein V4736_07890 [Bdellovibrionota bacterium]